MQWNMGGKIDRGVVEPIGLTPFPPKKKPTSYCFPQKRGENIKVLRKFFCVL